MRGPVQAPAERPGGTGERHQDALSGPAGAGLSRALAEREHLLGHCVHCGFCLPACPTYQELGDEADSPRGRLHLMRAVVEGRLDPSADAFQDHMDRCLGCRACETVCPSGVEYGHLLEHARAVATEARPVGLLTRGLLATMASPLRSRLFGAAGRLGRGTGIPDFLAREGAGGGEGSGGPWIGRLRLGMGMLAASSPPRELRSRGLRDGGRSGPEGRAPGGTRPGAENGGGAGVRPGAIPAGALPPAGSRGVVVLLEGCVQSGLFRRVNEATRKVLEVNGWRVEGSGPGCCGALHAHAGQVTEGAALARERAPQGDPPPILVTNAAGCGAHLRDQLEAGGSGPPGGRRVLDVSELLAGEDRRPVAGAPLPFRITSDAPCHLLHAQRVKDPPLRLLDAIPGLERIPLRDADRCCGGAGIYGITHPELGGRIGDDKVDAILETGADWVATGNPGCHMQIGAGLRMRGSPVQVVHPVELLAESYRRAGW